MEREIKFRAWDKITKQMGRVDEIVFKTQIIWFRWYRSETRQGYYQIPISDIILMQFTGLKDKNRKEIYEGDIVKWNGIIHIVMWVSGGLQLVQKDYVRPNFEDWHLCIPFGSVGFDTEVIGNIYENPELLKEV